MEGQDGDQDPAEAAAGGGVLLAEDHRDSEKDGLIYESSTLPRHCNFLGVHVLEKIVSGENHIQVNDLCIIYPGTKPPDPTKPQVLEHISGVKAFSTSAPEEVRAKLMAPPQSKEN